MAHARTPEAAARRSAQRIARIVEHGQQYMRDLALALRQRSMARTTTGTPHTAHAQGERGQSSRWYADRIAGMAESEARRAIREAGMARHAGTGRTMAEMLLWRA